MSTGNSVKLEFEMVPANGSTSANGESSRTDTYQNLVQNADLFWDTLRDFHRSSGINVKNIIMGGSSIDLHQLFVEVTSRGGLHKVIKDHKCSQVIRVFNPKSITNASFLLKKHYRKMLLQFEDMYYLQDPCLKNANHVFPIDGVIDGKFKDGYIVTMKMGSQELKGVLYHPTQTPVETHRQVKKEEVSQ